MLKVLVTGMIGSGKSTVCKKFNEKFGFDVFYSDIWAKELYKDKEVQTEVLEITGTLDKKEIANIIFSDYSKLERINNVFKPRVAKLFEKYCEENKDKDIILYESALLLGEEKTFDYIILVDCETETKVQRAMKRDKAPVEKVLDRLFAQMDMFCDDDNLKKVDFTILTDKNNDLIVDIIGSTLKSKIC